MTFSDLTTELKPQLDALIAALQVEPDERPAFAEAARGLFTAIQQLLEEHDLDWPPDAALAAVQAACITEQLWDEAAAVVTIRQYNAIMLAERASMN